MATNLEACIHHFMLETPQPSMPKVNGTCAHCGIERQFPAYINVEFMSQSDRHSLFIGMMKQKNEDGK